MRIVPFLLAIMTGLSVHAATNEDLLFYCAFDGSANATFASGQAAATSAVPPEFMPGVRGQAVVIGGSTNADQRIVDGIPVSNQPANNCYYSPDMNFDVQKGSVSFWLKPLDWDGKTTGFNVFFRTGIGNNFFMLYKYWSTDELLFLRGEQIKWTSAKNRISDWKRGQWHHVVATWSPAEMRLFIDGAMVCARRVRFPLEHPTPMEPLSVGPGGSWAKAFSGRSLIDEFRIHSRPLSDEDVIRLYRQDSANIEMDAGLLTVGEKTPTLDGRVDEFEYALNDVGLGSLKKISSKRRSLYGLSYDRSNLYVAIQSELDLGLATQPAVHDGDAALAERVELFLCPGDAARTSYRFAFTPSGGAYDEKNGDKQWNGEHARVTNALSNAVWTLEAAIPFSDLGLQGAPDGQRWRINIARVFTVPEELTSLAPVKGTLDDRSQFVTLVFRPDAPWIRNASWSDPARKQAAQDVTVQSTNNRSEIHYVSISDTTQDYGLRTYTVPLFSKGKSTPYKSPIWSGAPPDFSLGEIRITETRDGRQTPLYLRKTIYEEQSPMKTFFLYTQAKQRLFVSALRRAEGSIQARFLRPDGTCAFQVRQAIPADSTYFNALFDLDFDKLIPGDYTVKIDYIAPDGASTETWEQAYRIPRKDDPLFRPYVDEEANKVPAPWTPVKVRSQRSEVRDQGEGFQVSTWGRTYDFSKGFLFSSLMSQGKELMASPAVLRLNGQELARVTSTVVNPVSATDVTAVWDTTTDLGALIVSNRIRAHFDGYCEIAMTLAPAAGTQAITSLSLDIPLRGEAATLVRDSKHCVIMGTKSGAVGDYWSQDFSGGSFIWVGNDSIGFNWLAPDLENWNCKNTAKNVEIIRQGDTAILRFNLIDTLLKLDAPRTIPFAFMLTPSRPLDRKILRMRDQKDLQMWCQPWQYFAYPDYDTADRKAIEQAGKGVNEVFLYFGDGLTSPFAPEWAWWEEEWRAFRGGSRTYGEWTGDSKELKYRNSGCYVEAQGDTYFNFMQNKRHVFFERAKTPLTPKARNYYFDTGPSTSDRYREQALNVYRMIRRTGPEAKIWGHQGLLRLMPMQHFTDIICGGEALGSFVSRDGNYFKELTPEMFRATYSPYIWGVKMVFLDMTARMLHEAHPEKLINFSLNDPNQRRPLLHSYGYCIVHDVDINDGYAESKPLRDTIWAAQDTLGWDENVMFHSYWAQDAVKLVSPKSNRIMASAYTKDGKMLLAVLNDTDQEETVTLALDLSKLGVKAGLGGHDVWQPETAYTLSSSWVDKLPPRAFRLIQWGPSSGPR